MTEQDKVEKIGLYMCIAVNLAAIGAIVFIAVTLILMAVLQPCG